MGLVHASGDVSVNSSKRRIVVIGAMLRSVGMVPTQIRRGNRHDFTALSSGAVNSFCNQFLALVIGERCVRVII